jgi:arylsulfatase
MPVAWHVIRRVWPRLRCAIDYNKLTELDAKGWELYDLKEDFAETNNLAAKERDRLIAMIGMWYVEAGKYDVLPIDSRGTLRFADPRPEIAVGRKKYVYYPGTQVVPPDAGPRLVNVAHSVSVHVNVPKGGAEGVLYSMGGVDGGFSFYVQNRKLTYGYNYVADKRFKVQSSNGGLPEGDHVLSFEFTPTGKPDVAKGKGVPANVKLFLDGNQIGSGDLPVTIPLNLGLAAGVCVGSDAGAPVMTDYEPPFPFTGTVKKVLVDVSGETVEDMAGKIRMYLARQ